MLRLVILLRRWRRTRWWSGWAGRRWGRALDLRLRTRRLLHLRVELLLRLRVRLLHLRVELLRLRAGLYGLRVELLRCLRVRLLHLRVELLLRLLVRRLRLSG